MQDMLQCVVLLLALLLVMGFTGRRWWWIAATAIVLTVATLFSQISFFILCPIWVVFFLVLGCSQATQWRQKVLIPPIYDWFKSVMPPLSQTEQEAIAAGDVWWEGELFCGRPQWKNFLAMPAPSLTTEEQAFLDGQVNTLCQMLDDWQIIQDQDLSAQTWAYLKAQGFFGLCIPKEWGGKGFSPMAHSSIVARVASRSMSAAVTLMVPNSLGPAELLLHYGTEEQKKKYLTALAQGEETPCFALTSPEAGSDAASMQDTGIVCYGAYQGKQVVGIRLNWDKRYITLAPRATLLALAFTLHDPEGILGGEENIGITVCLVPTSHHGVVIGPRHRPMHMAFLNGTTRGKDVFIPMSYVVGGQEMCGHGWRMLMECLSVGRGISLPALSTSLGLQSFQRTAAYARIRYQFGVPIGHFEGVEEALAFIGGGAYLMEATRLLTAYAVTSGVKPALASAIAKYHLTEIGRKIIIASMDIHGGKAVQQGPSNYIASHYDAIPVSITVEGANILTRNLMIFGQGAVRCHPYVRDEIATLSIQSPEQAISRFDELLMSHIHYAITNTVRSFLYGLGGVYFIPAPVRGVTARYFRQLTRMSTVLAFVADFSMLFLGGKLKRKEFLSARLGDVLSYLYMASSVLKYYQDEGCHKEDQPFVHWSVQTCLHQIQIALDGFLANFPNRFLAGVLRLVIFPFGRAYPQPPADNILKKVSLSMQNPKSSLRERLTKLCFQSHNPDDVVCQLEEAFHRVVNIDEPLGRFRKACKQGQIKNYLPLANQLTQAVELGILSDEEAQEILETKTLVKKVLAVDEFTEDELMRNEACKKTMNKAG